MQIDKCFTVHAGSIELLFFALEVSYYELVAEIDGWLSAAPVPHGI